LGKQPQHTFKNDMRKLIQRSSSLHFYLLYLLLNSCHRNDTTQWLEAAPHWNHWTKYDWRQYLSRRNLAKLQGQVTRSVVSNVLRHFRRSYLKANKGSRKKVECVYHFQTVLMLFNQNYQSISSCWIVETTACQSWCLFRHNVFTNSTS